MTQGSTLFLKLVIYLIGIAVFGLCIILLGNAFFNESVGYYAPILIGMAVAGIPFFGGLYQGLKLLRFIDKGTAFSEDSVRAIAVLKYCAFVISVMYAAGMPYIISAAQRDDAPGVVLIGLILIAAPLVVGVCAAVLQKLLQQAIDLKTENELTV